MTFVQRLLRNRRNARNASQYGDVHVTLANLHGPEPFRVLRPEQSGADAVADSPDYNFRKHGEITLKPDDDEMTWTAGAPPVTPSTLQGRNIAPMKKRSGNDRYDLRSRPRPHRSELKGSGAKVSCQPMNNGDDALSGSFVVGAALGNSTSQDEYQQFDMYKAHVFDAFSRNFVTVAHAVEHDMPLGTATAVRQHTLGVAKPSNGGQTTLVTHAVKRKASPSSNTDKRRKVQVGPEIGCIAVPSTSDYLKKAGNPTDIDTAEIGGPRKYPFGQSAFRRLYRGIPSMFPSRKPIPRPTPPPYHMCVREEKDKIVHIGMRDRDDGYVDLNTFTEVVHPTNASYPFNMPGHFGQVVFYPQDTPMVDAH